MCYMFCLAGMFSNFITLKTSLLGTKCNFFFLLFCKHLVGVDIDPVPLHEVDEMIWLSVLITHRNIINDVNLVRINVGTYMVSAQ